MDEILWCHNSNETSSAVFSYGTICFECSSNYFNTEASVLFVVRILNLWMKHYIYNYSATIQTDHFSSTFTWYHFKI